MANDKKNKRNLEFFHAYEEMEAACCKKFGVNAQGVLLYITRLNGTKNAVGRDEYLPKIVGALDLYQRNMTEMKSDGAGANVMFPCPEVTSEDIAFCKKFQKLLEKRKDPLSVYLQKYKITRRWRIFGRWLIAVLILAILAAAAYFALKLL